MRHRRLRRVHRPLRRQARRELSPARDAGARPQRAHDRGARQAWRLAPGTGGFRQPRRAAVRLLHPRRGDGGRRAAERESASHRGRDPLRHRGQSVPLHGLYEDAGRDHRGRRRRRRPEELGMASVMKTTRDVKGIGLSIPRPDAPDKVTGQVQYVADLNPKGLLHAKLLRSPHAHARIVRIDVSRARALPGVRAVLTAADIPQLRKKAPTRAHAVLAIDRVVFAGQPIAAVAADEVAIAEEALDLIDVQYEVLPVAADPLESMKPGAPPVAELGTEADTSEAL